MKTSKHAQERGEERMNLDIKAFERLAHKALEEGITHSESKGNLHKYMTGRILAHNNYINNARIYGEFLYLFSNETLVTVFQLPHNLKRLAAKLQSEKKSHD